MQRSECRPFRFPWSLLGASAVIIGAAAAQPTWLGPTGGTPTGRYAHAAAYDAQRGEVVLFGGQDGLGLRGDTWVFNGYQWLVRDQNGGPSPRSYAMMAYDKVRQRTYLFGGIDANGYRQDVWSWDGSVWSNLGNLLPEPLANAAVCYDSARGQTLILGGANAAGLTTHMVVWTGNQCLTSSLQVTPRQGGAMTFDELHGKIVLFGGRGASNYFNDTEILSYAASPFYYTMSQAFANSPMSPRQNSAMAFARYGASYVVVLFGGHGVNGDLGDTWTWDGSNWSLLPFGTGPWARQQCSLVATSSQSSLLLFGGIGPVGLGADTWRLDLTPGFTSWTWLTTPASPPPMEGAAFAFEPTQRQLLMFGGTTDGVHGTDDMYLYDGNWNGSFTLSPSPSPRFNHRMVLDTRRNLIVVYGGHHNGVDLGDVWEWDWNTGWTAKNVVTGPIPRQGPGFAYDSARGVCVVFGGTYNGSAMNDTWEWNGTAWRKVTTATTPPALADVAMCYDAARARTVMVSRNPTTGSLETWEYDGVNWSGGSNAAFTGRSGAGLVYDPIRTRCVLWGGTNGSYSYSAVYEWNGSTWTFRSAAPAPQQRDRFAFGYDPSRGRFVAFGGRSLTPLTRLADAFELQVAFDKVGDGEVGGGLTLTQWGDAELGNPYQLVFPSPRGQALVLFGQAPALRNPVVFGGPLFCRQAMIYTTPIFILPAPGNPTAMLTVGIPSAPALAGVGMIVQGVSADVAGCQRATDAYAVVIQR